jgi:nucleotide-binding universal stress UspA family protein
MTWKRIVCGVDLSELSRGAMREAARLAAASGAELTLLHVFEPPPAVATDMLVAPGAGVYEAAAREVEESLAGWQVEAQRLGARTVNVRRITGHAAAELSRFAAARGADLLVLSTHGRRGLAHALLGSVAERVVREAPCSVLVVRGSPLV